VGSDRPIVRAARGVARSIARTVGRGPGKDAGRPVGWKEDRCWPIGPFVGLFIKREATFRSVLGESCGVANEFVCILLLLKRPTGGADRVPYGRAVAFQRRCSSRMRWVRQSGPAPLSGRD